MLRKRFYIRIELELHAITCPGVWLCADGSGYLEATIKTLGYFFRTGAMEPRFPLLCHDRYTMEGYFKSVATLTELESVLAAEQLEVTLWQSGRRLAHFCGKLHEVMQPSLPKLSCEHNINVQLLMKPTPAFPGIIAPKVELSSRINVQDRLSATKHELSSSLGSAVNSFNSKHLAGSGSLRPGKNILGGQRFHQNCIESEYATGSHLSNFTDKRRQQPVCHSRDVNRELTEQTSTLAGSRQDSEQRRLSTCSSLLSNISYPLSKITATCSNSNTSSKCMHECDLEVGIEPKNEHQQRCEICQTYQKVFQMPITKYN